MKMLLNATSHFQRHEGNPVVQLSSQETAGQEEPHQSAPAEARL